MKKFINSKPSEVSNQGEEVLGAARHRNDTYDNPEERKAREFKKTSTKGLKVLKAEYMQKFALALSESTEAAKACLIEYETKKCMESVEELKAFTGPMDQFKAKVLACEDSNQREVLRKKYNSLLRTIRKIKYYRPIELPKYFEPKAKESFKEINGIESPWVDASIVYKDVSSSVASLVRAVQFGNSVPDVERKYIMHNLNHGLIWLKKIVPAFDSKGLAFAFGARGNAKSVAYYVDAKKLISVNRHNDGSIVHEIGHAIDYSLGLISHSMPQTARLRYRDKIRSMDDLTTAQKNYYIKDREIFARMFEAYVWDKAQTIGPNLFMLYCDPASPLMPQLCGESIEFMESVLSKLTSSKES